MASAISGSEIGDHSLVQNVSTPEQILPKPTHTVIRLKRRIDESPSQILVVSFKKLKTEGLNGSGGTAGVEESTTLVGVAVNNDDNEENGICSRVLRLVGTVPDEQHGTVAQTVSKVLETEKEKPVSRPIQETSFRQNIKARRSKITEKAREDFKQNSEENRFKMVASKRGITENGLDEQENELFKLLDLVTESDIKQEKVKVKPDGFEPGNVTCNGQPMIKEDSSVDKDYVYDLYISHDPRIEDFACDQILSVEEGDDFMNDWRQPENEELFADDDEDSNAEDNWRNDYPDSDIEENSHGGTGSSNIMYGVYGAMKNVGLSDSSDDDVVYGIEDNQDGISFEKRYSRYKQRIANEYADEVVSTSSGSEEEGALYD